MSLLIEIKGITRLSELEIDTDKDWQAKGISNLKQLAALMSKGDIVIRGDSVLIRMSPGPEGYVLTSAGPGKMPSWAPAGGALKYYFPVTIGLSFETLRKNLSRAVQVNDISFNTNHWQAFTDAPEDDIKMLIPAIGKTIETNITSVAHAENRSSLVCRDLYILVDGAVSETNVGVQTDETLAARNGTGNDLNLPPMTPSVGDKYYLGSNKPFRGIWINIGIAGAGNWTVVWYYWNGSNWVQFSDEDDQTSSFMQSSLRRSNWSLPVDWIQNTIQGMNLYWAKAEVTYYSNQTTRPYGTQAWVIVK